ncbi:glycoside hydrolase superfamily [Kockovaella imperatae]|uniref:alpha-galactosidase n=1 Tax=Kockovaella imperatae TaxID=4999 RepID=A0A1Y1ULX0_9TREE|nr:glycoside hydrolase superfamily [Kockovaella imperatae]ORX39043.1 glycoside hydrolase superfamily [Kockovaella imperatae]
MSNMTLLANAILGLMAAGAASAAATPTHFKPTLTDTFIYDLDNVPIPAPVVTSKYGVKVNAHVYVVDGQEHTAQQIANYHANGKKVICYFSAGSWEPERPDALNLSPECYCGKGVSYNKRTGECTGKNANQNKLDGWDEWYLDLHNPSCISQVKAWQNKRIQSFIAKGCDGIDPDNVDEFANTQAFGVTAQDEVNYLMWLSQTAKKGNLAIDLKNAPSLLVDDNGNPTQWQKQLIEAFDFSVIEQCHEGDNCDQFDAFLAAGKPQIQVEYNGDGYEMTKCPSLEDGQHLLVYNTPDLDSTLISLECSD